MSYYTASRLGDLSEIIQLVAANPLPGEMLDRFIGATADNTLEGILIDWRADITQAELQGQNSAPASLAKIAEACQGIEDKAKVAVQVSTDSDGTIVRVETEGSAVEYP